jgi:hypothetical protein
VLITVITVISNREPACRQAGREWAREFEIITEIAPPKKFCPLTIADSQFFNRHSATLLRRGL